jgi:hypothetical protein
MRKERGWPAIRAITSASEENDAVGVMDRWKIERAIRSSCVEEHGDWLMIYEPTTLEGGCFRSQS